MAGKKFEKMTEKTAANRSEISIPWPFAPSRVALNNDTNLLKLAAMLAMLCDHAGKMLFPQYPVMRIIGRMAFPIYSYCLAVGCVYTRNMLKYLERMVLLALISQPIYVLAMGHSTQAMYAVSFAEKPVQAALNFYVKSWAAHPGILLSLSLGLLAIWSLREKRLILSVAIAVFVYLAQTKLDYGWRGVALMVLFYLFIERRWMSLPMVLAFMLWWGLSGAGYSLFGVKFGIQAFAMLSLPLIYLHTRSGLRLPKWLFYAFYPVHLALIYLLDRFVM